jgi:hypothetical protein
MFFSAATSGTVSHTAPEKPLRQLGIDENLAKAARKAAKVPGGSKQRPKKDWVKTQPDPAPRGISQTPRHCQN